MWLDEVAIGDRDVFHRRGRSIAVGKEIGAGRGPGGSASNRRSSAPICGVGRPVEELEFSASAFMAPPAKERVSGVHISGDGLFIHGPDTV